MAYEYCEVFGKDKVRELYQDSRIKSESSKIRYITFYEKLEDNTELIHGSYHRRLLRSNSRDLGLKLVLVNDGKKEDIIYLKGLEKSFSFLDDLKSGCQNLDDSKGKEVIIYRMGNQLMGISSNFEKDKEE
ncbi:MAG: hypothetical protein WC867_03700 [Candidatus Pacearchaeota archaeon]|jgi:hypothetical protein